MSLHMLDTRNACPDENNLNTEPAGYVIDEQGREIAITEQMIQQACAELDQHWRPVSPSMSESRV
ncbi:MULTISPECIES: PA1571 family protein [Pseudomonas]|uniref:PA1571 family protein n=1 Tax=Pseudomonas TaxID=286 RepID=UPI001CC24171|nr:MULTISPECIES: PA1571 family protein [Pseudomonas]